MLDHAQPFRLGIAARSGGGFDALQRLALVDIGLRPVQPGLFIVPQHEADGAVGPHIGAAENARQLHHQRRARTVVIGGLAPADAVHMGADDIHLARMGSADLGAPDFLAVARHGRRGVEGAQGRVGLGIGITVDAGGAADAARPRAADIEVGRIVVIGLGGGDAVLRLRTELVGQPFGVGAAVTLQLRLDPVQRVAVALRTLAAVTELGQALDGGLVFAKVEPLDQNADRVGRGLGKRRRDKTQRGQRANDAKGQTLLQLQQNARIAGLNEIVSGGAAAGGRLAGPL